jgi:hypothetical protein
MLTASDRQLLVLMAMLPGFRFQLIHVGALTARWVTEPRAACCGRNCSKMVIATRRRLYAGPCFSDGQIEANRAGRVQAEKRS